MSKKGVIITIIIIVLIMIAMVIFLILNNKEEENRMQEANNQNYTEQTKNTNTQVQNIVEKNQYIAQAPVFNFETRTVTLNSGYEMPLNGIGTYSLTGQEMEM